MYSLGGGVTRPPPLFGTAGRAHGSAPRPLLSAPVRAARRRPKKTMGLHVNTPPIKANTTAYGLNRKTLSHPKNTEKKGIPAGASRFFRVLRQTLRVLSRSYWKPRGGSVGPRLTLASLTTAGFFSQPGAKKKKKVNR